VLPEVDFTVLPFVVRETEPPEAVRRPYSVVVPVATRLVPLLLILRPLTEVAEAPLAVAMRFASMARRGP
jgi:hypothetical protein